MQYKLLLLFNLKRYFAPTAPRRSNLTQLFVENFNAFSGTQKLRYLHRSHRNLKVRCRSPAFWVTESWTPAFSWVIEPAKGMGCDGQLSYWHLLLLLVTAVLQRVTKTGEFESRSTTSVSKQTHTYKTMAIAAIISRDILFGSLPSHLT